MTAPLADDLLAAVQRGDRERVAALLAAQPDGITITDDDGMTLVHWAVAGELVELLTDLTVYPEAPLDARQTSHGRTPLHMAAIKAVPTLLKILIDAGADMLATDRQGLRPLDVAATPVAMTILRAPTLYPDRALREAIIGKNLTRVRRQVMTHPELCAVTDAKGHTPVHWAITAGDEPMVGVLLAAGVPVNAADREGQTPLHEAIRKGDLALTKLLLKAGASPSVTDNQGITPLHIAAGRGDATRSLVLPPPIAIAPLTVGADQAAVGQCAFDFDAPADIAPRMPLPSSASAIGSPRDDDALAHVLLDAGADVNARARGGLTPLHLAAATGQIALVICLLHHGADADPRLAPCQATPVHLAAVFGHLAVLTLLDDAGADLFARDSYGRTVAELRQ